MVVLVVIIVGVVIVIKLVRIFRVIGAESTVRVVGLDYFIFC